MKKCLMFSVIGAGALCSCSQQEPATVTNLPTTTSYQEPVSHLALPGQATVSSETSETDEAFDRQVEAYASQESTPSSAAQPSLADIPTPVPSAPTAPAAQETTTAPAGAPASAAPSTSTLVPAARLVDVTPDAVDAAAAAATSTSAAPVSQPAELPTPVSAAQQAMASLMGQGTAVPAQPEPPQQPSSAAALDYTVNITNNTAGLLYIEAQDDSGTIYPCGIMPPHKSYSTPMTQAAPINGKITVVVRDPDKEGAPEIRRYHVPPPSSYQGKTIDITILPGGNYTAHVGGALYQATPGALNQAPPATQSPAGL